MIQVLPIAGLKEFGAGDDVGALLAEGLRGVELTARDIVVVTQKIVSKAEGLRVRLTDVVPGAQALAVASQCLKDPRLVELVLSESIGIVRVAPHVLITRHRLGLVMANAGIDASNIGHGGADEVLLLPKDPDASAVAIQAAIRGVLGEEVGVIISDSFGRPWRHGVVNVAIGSAGVAALIDRRGMPDRDGRPMQVTRIAFGDLVASAAGLAMGEGAEGVPAALVRGVGGQRPLSAATGLVRPVEEDLFR